MRSGSADPRVHQAAAEEISGRDLKINNRSATMRPCSGLRSAKTSTCSCWKSATLPKYFRSSIRIAIYLREWLPWVDSTETVDDTLSFIRSSLEQFASSKGFVAGIWSDERFCGVIGTHKLDLLNRKGEIGYWLGALVSGPGHHDGRLPGRGDASFERDGPEPGGDSLRQGKRKKLRRRRSGWGLPRKDWRARRSSSTAIFMTCAGLPC